MDKRAFIEHCTEYFATSGLNSIPKDKALSKELECASIFDAPLIAVGTASDPGFARLKEDGVVGALFMLPGEWLPSARTVLSFFFPFTEAIRESNKEDMARPSKGWLNGRIEGQAFIDAYTAGIVDYLVRSGYAAMSPSLDARFSSSNAEDDEGLDRHYTTNWSERHVAFVCGLGTFGLSAGLITEKGVAGRLSSIVTRLYMEPDDKRFSSHDAYCARCGRCALNCPADAISLESGKNHKRCALFLDAIREENAPWYGCGKCQVNVPCEYGVPRTV